MKPAPVVSRRPALMRGWDPQNREVWHPVYVVRWESVGAERYAVVRCPRGCRHLVHPNQLRRAS